MRVVPALLLVALSGGVAPLAASERPNILWITSEDNGPHLGAYGDHFADTPHLDALAARGTIYLNAWSNAPVCAPARTTIISGLYPPCTGAEHMRSMTRLPDTFRMFPCYLREAGYYCTNNSKEDYNLEKTGTVWDDSSRRAHWRNRAPDQPFFAVFNFTVSHESQLRKRPHQAVHDPARVRVPAYHPDTPEVRQDWAQYYDKVTEMDALAGRVLEELAEDKLTDSTIIFYYGDHGSGMPRSKRWPYNSGLHVPLIVHLPARFQHLAAEDYAAGGRSERLVGFIDLAPTVLSLAGIKPPAFLQGHAFLGEYATDPPRYGYGFRGRMDERYDMVRVVRDARYLYVRNYMPHKIYGQYIAYMFQTPTTRVWKQHFDEGRLSPEQARFWQTKPAEELYDLQDDPDEVNNLAESPQHAPVLSRLRAAQQRWELQIRDVGFLPEDEIHTRSAGASPFEMGHDPQKYPLRRILAAAELASRGGAAATGELGQLLSDDDSAVRYWAALGLLMRGRDAIEATRSGLRRALADDSPSVAIVAAEALGRYGNDSDLNAALPVLERYSSLDEQRVFVAMLALNAIDALDDRAAPLAERLRRLPRQHADVPPRMRNYVGNLLDKTLADLADQ